MSVQACMHQVKQLTDRQPTATTKQLLFTALYACIELFHELLSLFVKNSLYIYCCFQLLFPFCMLLMFCLNFLSVGALSLLREVICDKILEEDTYHT
jgi:hypothetical protein